MSPIPDMHAALDILDEQTSLLLVTLDAMDEEELRAPSLLPGWTRAHVLAHVDGNARGLGRLARYATDGVPRAMYQSMDSRNADIALRTARTLGEHRDAVAHSARELRRELAAVTDGDLLVTLGTGAQIPARDLAMLRVQEVAVHHADLGIATYDWSQWPVEFVTWRLHLIIDSARSRQEFPVAWLDVGGDRLVVLDDGDVGIEGSSLEILAWVMGRASGEDLTVSGQESLPAPPEWWR